MITVDLVEGENGCMVASSPIPDNALLVVYGDKSCSIYFEGDELPSFKYE